MFCLKQHLVKLDYKFERNCFLVLCLCFYDRCIGTKWNKIQHNVALIKNAAATWGNVGLYCAYLLLRTSTVSCWEHFVQVSCCRGLPSLQVSVCASIQSCLHTDHTAVCYREWNKEIRLGDSNKWMQETMISDWLIFVIKYKNSKNIFGTLQLPLSNPQRSDPTCDQGNNCHWEIFN